MDTRLLRHCLSISCVFATSQLYAQTADQAFSTFCSILDPSGSGTAELEALCSGGGTVNGGAANNFSFNTLSPGDNTSTAALTNVGVSQLNIAIEDRLKERRGGENSGVALNISSFDSANHSGIFSTPLLGGGASADGALEKAYGLFGTLKYTDGDRDKTVEVAGFDYESLDLQLGIDYKFTSQIIVGITANFVDSETESSGSSSTSKGDQLGLSVFTSFYTEPSFYIDVIAGYASGETDYQRDLSYTVEGNDGTADVTVTNSTIAKANTDSEATHASIGAGYTFYSDAWSLNPYVQLNWLERKVDDYRESATAQPDLGNLDDIEQLIIDNFLANVAEQKIRSLTSVAGIDASKALATSWGVLLPKASLSWIHQYENEEDLTAQIVSSAIGVSPNFSVETPSLDDDYFVFGIGATATYANNLVSFIYLDTVLGHSDISQYSISAGLRKEF